MNSLKEKLKILPENSGVYIMLDEYENILYVGKAKNLKNRVRQYFHSSVKNDKTMILVSKINDFRYIITPNEYEALILENNLIKENNPPYNILLKDDKTYPYIRINVKEKFPRVEVTYRMKSDGARYFGPYMLGISVRDTIEIIHSVFPLRVCNKLPKKECLNYHIKRCCAPCIDNVNELEYKKVVSDAIKFLEGNDNFVAEILQEKMLNCAEKQEFELAKYYRDTLNILEKLVRKQTIPFKQNLDIDVFTFVTNGEYSVINCFAIRGGKYLGGNNFPYQDVDYNNGITSFIMQHYQKNPIICNEILVNDNLEFKEELADFLTQKAGKKIVINYPLGGIRKQIIEMGVENGKEFLTNQLERYNHQQELTSGAVKQLQELLKLPMLPRRMECYDISHISGTNKVSSMVVFFEGEKESKSYRHFKIKTVVGNNDFASMYETLFRRFNNINSQDVSFSQMPDLIIIDGGKGQLSSAMQAAKDANVNVNIISLAKREEEVFLPGISESIILPKNSLALKLIVRIRDEAHRFAITYHKNLRQKQMLESELTSIEGIGKVKATTLMTHFKKIENIYLASESELLEVNKINKKNAKDIIEFFKNKGEMNEV